MTELAPGDDGTFTYDCLDCNKTKKDSEFEHSGNSEICLDCQKKGKWIIKNWMGQDANLNGKKEFESFGDARAAIDEFAYWLCDLAVKNGKYKTDSDEYDEAFNGINDDLYAINVDYYGREIADHGQYSV